MKCIQSIIVPSSRCFGAHAALMASAGQDVRNMVAVRRAPTFWIYSLDFALLGATNRQAGLCPEMFCPTWIEACCAAAPLCSLHGGVLSRQVCLRNPKRKKLYHIKVDDYRRASAGEQRVP